MIETLGNVKQDDAVRRMQTELNSILRMTMKYRRCPLEKAYRYVRGQHLYNGRLIEFYRNENDMLIARLTRQADSEDPTKTLPRIQEKIKAMGLALKTSGFGLEPNFLNTAYLPLKTLAPEDLELYTQGIQGF